VRRSKGAGEWRTRERVEREGNATTDASMVAADERMDATHVITLDRRHFTVVGPKQCEAFEPLPRGGAR
jgi:hypothetical protein